MRGRQAIVIEAVGRSIVSGEVAVGEVLPREAELVERFGLSRTSVREAMRVLAAKGLVDIRQKVGTRVRPQELWNVFDTDILRWHNEAGLGAEIMRDLVEVRQIMEPAAARLAAGRATIADHHRMAKALAAMTASTEDPDDYASADVEFHLAVYAASHNSLLRQFGSVVADFMKLTFTVQQHTTMDPGELAADAASHATVYRAIDRGNGEQAEEAMLTVVLDGKNALVRALGGADGGPVGASGG
ncbi:MAG: GntR family transcriptional regulator [Micrococcales bacterium 73-15]|nr:MAG: GntR family transcriptional regulator [Micrococcales bacterium 73-15]